MMRAPHRNTWHRAGLFFATVIAVVHLAGTAWAEVARVNAVAGAVTLVRDGMTSALMTGSALNPDDEIVTAADSRAEVVFADGSTLVIGANSRIIVRRFDVNSDTSRTGLLDLLQGIVRMALTPGADSDVGIATRTAIASVRSTEWIVEAKPDTSAVFVISGRVAVAGNGVPGEVILNAGEGTDVALGKPPSGAKPWGVKRVRQFYERTSRP